MSIEYYEKMKILNHEYHSKMKDLLQIENKPLNLSH
jgi:hypothetical protein